MKSSKKQNCRILLRTQVRQWFFFLLTVLFCQNAFPNAIFYQPLSRDSLITKDQWSDLFDKVYLEGYREIVIQWTQYGSTSFTAKENFLKEVLHIAETKKFRIWLGLYLPDDYYLVMENNNAGSAQYFKSALTENRKRISLLEVQSLVSNDTFAGWYLPMELTHKYLHQDSNKNRETVLLALREFASSVQEKIAVSYFLSKTTSLKSAFFDITLLNTMGFNLWLQQGNGLKKNTVANQLIRRMDCDIGVIYENFIQISDNTTPFEAIKNSENKVLDNLKDCQKRLTFSLRYLSYSPLQLN